MHTEEGTLKNEIVVTKGNKGERERERERERVSVVFGVFGTHDLTLSDVPMESVDTTLARACTSSWYFSPCLLLDEQAPITYTSLILILPASIF